MPHRFRTFFVFDFLCRDRGTARSPFSRDTSAPGSRRASSRRWVLFLFFPFLVFFQGDVSTHPTETFELENLVACHLFKGTSE